MAKSDVPADSSVLTDLFAVQERVVQRIRELEPYAEELASLREQAERMGIDVSAKRTAKAGTATKRASTTKRGKANTAKPRRRRRQASGETRADQVLKAVTEQPGSTIPAIAETLGVDSTGLYRVVSSLEENGRLRKDGRQLHPVTEETDSSEASVEETTAS